jgi:Protein of unknown function (DUF3485)
MIRRIAQFAPVVVTLGLLGYIAAFARLEVVTTGVAEFRERSKEAMFAVPRKVGNWVAESVEIDARARELLQANAGFSFRFKDNRGREAIYMVVQVQDARYMSGHAPIHCYPGTGWEILSQTPQTWTLGGGDGEFEIHGTEYRLKRRVLGGMEQRWNVRHFFVFPDGTIDSTLRSVDAAAEDYRRLAYGVTQVQFITQDAMPQNQREQAFKELVGSERSLEMFRVLRTGIPK